MAAPNLKFNSVVLDGIVQSRFARQGSPVTVESLFAYEPVDPLQWRMLRIYVSHGVVSVVWRVSA